MANKEEKTGSKQTIALCCSQPIHLARGGCSAGILKMAAEHLPPKRRTGVCGRGMWFIQKLLFPFWSRWARCTFFFFSAKSWSSSHWFQWIQDIPHSLFLFFLSFCFFSSLQLGGFASWMQQASWSCFLHSPQHVQLQAEGWAVQEKQEISLLKNVTIFS